MATLTVRLSDRLKKDLDKLSKEEKVPSGQIVRESLGRYIAVRRFRKLRRKVLPFAESQGLITDEDIFKALKN